MPKAESPMPPVFNASQKESRRRLRLAELLLSVSHKIAAIDSLDEVLQTLVEMTTAELRAERGSLFLNDPSTGELYSRVAQGNFQHEIRILNTSGFAGHVFTTGKGVIIHDAYADARFNRSIDEQTGFTTHNILCVPIKTVKGEIIGVAQTLNKKSGKFTKQDLHLLEAMTSQGTLALQSAQFIERMQAIRRQEMEFIDVVSEVTADIKLGSLLQKVMGEATRLLEPWRVETADGRCRVEFRPEGERAGRINLGVLSSDYHQPYGTFSGTAVDDSGREHAIRDYFGARLAGQDANRSASAATPARWWASRRTPTRWRAPSRCATTPSGWATATSRCSATASGRWFST